MQVSPGLSPDGWRMADDASSLSMGRIGTFTCSTSDLHF